MPDEFRVHLNLPPVPYDIIVVPGILHQLADTFQRITNSARLCMVTDSNVAQYHLAAVTTALKTRYEIIPCILPAGEQHKLFSNIERIYDTFLPAGIDRNTPLLALGGGVVGDMTGFAAATILRGVPFIQIPTTLLAMVDASVGGKTGINHSAGKNLIGAFHQPRAVIIDPQTLLTLPDRELVGGLAECIKHDIIRDATHFHQLSQILPLARSRDIKTLTALIAHNVAIKARVVEADPLEKGERAHLNFGHTFAHAFEKVSQFAWSHGEAVALGMLAAARMSRDLGLLDDASVRLIQSTISAAGLPTTGLTQDPEACADAMDYDKKNAGKKIRFILPDRIGHVIIRDDIPRSAILSAIASLKG